MKRFLLILVFVLCFLTSSVQAKTIKVLALENFSTLSPSDSFGVQIIKTLYLNNGIFLEKGSIISGSVVEVYRPKFGNRDSHFEFLPNFLTYNEKTINISNSKMAANVLAYKPFHPLSLAGNVAIKLANFVVLGSSQAISFTMGATSAPKGTKFKSGVDRMYRDSFISLVEAGKELDIHRGDILILKLKERN